MQLNTISGLENIFEGLDEVSKECIYEYHKKKKSIRQIQRENPEWEITIQTIRNHILRAGVGLRTRSQAMKNFWNQRKKKRR